MELGNRLRQARLEAGLSQRQLCGQEITRNMLSQIENGSARPSMDTLRYLANQLGKPISYFLEEDAVVSPNQALIRQAMETTDASKRLALLEAYQEPDPLFDDVYHLLTALACMDAAEQATRENRRGYALTLLGQASQAGENTRLYTPELERRRLLLCYRTEAAAPETLAAWLPDNTDEMLLRASAALNEGAYSKCLTLLDCADNRPVHWHYLRAEACRGMQDYPQAIVCYQAAEDTLPHKVYPRLEACYKALEDYRMAYIYACKQRELL